MSFFYGESSIIASAVVKLLQLAKNIKLLKGTAQIVRLSTANVALHAHDYGSIADGEDANGWQRE